MTCLGVLERGERGDDNGTSLKVRGGIEMSTTVLHSRAAPSLKYLPSSFRQFFTSSTQKMFNYFFVQR